MTAQEYVTQYGIKHSKPSRDFLADGFYGKNWESHCERAFRQWASDNLHKPIAALTDEERKQVRNQMRDQVVKAFERANGYYDQTHRTAGALCAEVNMRIDLLHGALTILK